MKISTQDGINSTLNSKRATTNTSRRHSHSRETRSFVTSTLSTSRFMTKSKRLSCEQSTTQPKWALFTNQNGPYIRLARPMQMVFAASRERRVYPRHRPLTKVGYASMAVRVKCSLYTLSPIIAAKQNFFFLQLLFFLRNCPGPGTRLNQLVLRLRLLWTERSSHISIAFSLNLVLIIKLKQQN